MTREFAAEQGDPAFRTYARLGVRGRRITCLVECEIDQVVMRKVRMQGHILQSAVALRRWGWQSVDGRRVKLCGAATGGVVNQAQAHAALRDQRIARGQRCDGE